MKKLLIPLFSLFLLSSPSVFADDISNFSIEGMSIGDSLLDYMTEDEILEAIELTINLYTHLKEPNKYAEVYLFKDFPVYDKVAVFVKNNSANQYLVDKNEKFTILQIRGLITYIEDFDSCIEKRNEIAEILSSMFPDTQKTEKVFAHSSDPSRDSIIDGVYLNFDSGDVISAHCSNFEEIFRKKHNHTEGISVAVRTTEIMSWMRNKK